MRRILVILAIGTGCGPLTPDTPEVAGVGQASTALAVPTAAGAGAWMVAKKSSSALANITQAETLLNGYPGASGQAERSFLLPSDLNGSEGVEGVKGVPGDFSLSAIFGEAGTENYATSYSGWLKVPATSAASNPWAFLVGSDDGYRLRIHNGSTLTTSAFETGRTFAYGATNGKATVVTFPSAGGVFPFELTVFESVGSSSVEFLWRQGSDDAIGAANTWALVPKDSLYAPDLRATLMAGTDATTPLAVGGTVRWTVTLRNVGLTPVYPASATAANPWPDGVTGTGVLFSNCINDNLAYAATGTLPAGVTSSVVDCSPTRKRISFFLSAPLLPGESRTFDYTTTVNSSGTYCDEGYAIGSSNDLPAASTTGLNRVARISNDPAVDDVNDVQNAPTSQFAQGVADDDSTCITVGNVQPVFAVTAPAASATFTTRRVAVTGRARPAAQVAVTLAVPGGATASCVATADSAANWTCTPATDLVDGAWTASARVRDLAGDEGPVLQRAFTVLATPITLPTLATVKSPTNVRQPLFSGTAPAGTTVSPYNAVNTQNFCSTTATAQGEWSCTPTVPLVDATYAVRAKATDGVRTGHSVTQITLVVDTVAPPAPTVSSASPVATTRTPALTGTAQAGTTVNVRARATDGTLSAPVCTAVATGGNYSCTPTPPLLDGTYVFEADATDDAGNTSAKCSPSASTDCVNQFTLTVDLAAPAPPVFDPVASPTRTVPPISGTAEAGSRVRVREGAATFCDVVATTGRFSCPARVFADGSRTVVGTAADGAGNTSPERSLSFDVDATAPEKPSMTALASPSTTTRPSFSGRGEAGGTVRVQSGLTTICTATVNSNGAWTCTASADLQDGSYTFTVVVRDAAGNDSPPSEGVAYVLDTTPPLAPTLGSITTPTADRRPVFTGTAEPGATVSVSVGSVVACTTTAGNSGAFSCQPTGELSDGSYLVTASAVDAAGNAGQPSAASRLVVDGTGPAAPTLDALARAVGNDPKPTFKGTADPNVTVRVREGISVLCATKADADGHFECTPADRLSDGRHVFTAVAIDEAGNSGGDGNQIAYELDTVAPAAPVLLAPPELTRDRQPEIAGTAEKNTHVTVREANLTICEADVAANGLFSCTPGTPLFDGTHDLVAIAKDVAGNVSQPSAPVQWVVDDTAPEAPEIVTPAEGEEIGRALAISGTVGNATRVDVFVDGARVAQTQVTDGKWAVTLSEDGRPTIGRHIVTAQASDQAGNLGPMSAEVSVIIVGIVDVVGGCTSTAPTPLAILALAAVFAGRRRRARS